jgi:hypothetical protein
MEARLMAPEITIIRNAPPPPARETRGRKTPHPGVSQQMRYPFEELAVGDAFDLPITSSWNPADGRFPEYNRLTAAISNRNKRNPEKRFIARMLDNYAVRVWRLR